MLNAGKKVMQTARIVIMSPPIENGGDILVYRELSVCLSVTLFVPALFICVLEALSYEFCTGVPWELLYADDLADTLK